MSSQRSGIALGCVLVLVATAGCLGALTGTEPLSFSANETVVTESALDDTGYAHVDNQTINNTVTVSVQGQERDVRVTSHFNFYNRSVDPSEFDRNASELSENASMGPDVGAQFAVLSTPAASVGGVSANPLSSLPTEELVRRFFERARDAQGADEGNATRDLTLTLVDNRTVASLDAERTVSTYLVETDDASAPDAGSGLVHVATFQREGDLIVVVAAHPSMLDEAAQIDRLLGGLERKT